MTLLRLGCTERATSDEWCIGDIDITKLTKVSVKKKLPKREDTPRDSASDALYRAMSEVDALDLLHEHDQAISILKNMEQSGERDPLILQRLGYHYLWSNPKRALEYSSRYMELRPADPSGPFNAACAAAQLGLRDEAILLLRRAIDGNASYRLRAAELMGEDFQLLANDPEFRLLIRVGEPQV
jgi:tetratricopeptide (TPR) repeat protein